MSKPNVHHNDLSMSIVASGSCGIVVICHTPKSSTGGFGALRASVWANRELAAYRLPIALVFDNVAAGFGSSGQWQIQRNQRDAILLRCIMQTLEERLGQQPSFAHVKPYTGDAHNECVDALASDALKKGVLASPIDFHVTPVLEEDSPLCAHWPLLARTTCPNNAMPKCSHGTIGWTYPTTKPDPEIVWQNLEEQKVRIDVKTHLQLRCATYNVRTLKDNGEVVGIGITAFLRAQLVDKHHDIICLK